MTNQIRLCLAFFCIFTFPCSASHQDPDGFVFGTPRILPS
jgi:hypothetical protein